MDKVTLSNTKKKVFICKKNYSSFRHLYGRFENWNSFLPRSDQTSWDSMRLILFAPGSVLTNYSETFHIKPLEYRMFCECNSHKSIQIRQLRQWVNPDITITNLDKFNSVCKSKYVNE